MFVADAKKIFNIRGQWTEEKLEETMADVMVNGESAKRSEVSLLMVRPIPRLALQRRTKKATTRPNFVPAVHQEARPIVLVPDDDDTSCLYTEPVRIQRLQTIGAGATVGPCTVQHWKDS